MGGGITIVVPQLRPHSVGQYLNETMFLGTHNTTAGCYEPDAFARLQTLKRVYDPHNTFRSL